MQDHNTTINIEDYEIVSQVGQGRDGVVYAVKKKSNNVLYAVKVLKQEPVDRRLDDDDDHDEENIGNSIYNEIRSLRQCQHPTIVRFYGLSLRDMFGNNRYTLVFDYYKNDTLSKLIKDDNYSSDVDNTQRQIILIGIARGMLHIHQNHIIHNDLKPSNVLLDDELHPHITDFSGSNYYESYEPALSQSCNQGTPFYMAPEVLNGDVTTYKADVYSFGILMYEVVTGEQPYQNTKNLGKFYNDVITENLRPKFNVHVKNSFKNLMERCWSKYPERRPTFEELFNMLAYGKDPILGVDDQNYYLDDVDVERVHEYLNEINSEESLSHNVSSNEVILEESASNSMISLQALEYEERILQLENQITEMKEEKTRFIQRFDNMFDQLDQKLKHHMNLTESRFHIFSSSITAAVIPNDMIQIPNNLFSNFTQLAKVMFPQSIRIIGEFAFAGCASLTEICFPENLVTIENYAFVECTALKKVTFPSSLKTIGMNAFNYCISLRQIVIPPSVVSIGQSAFRNCKALDYVSISESTVLGSNVFFGSPYSKSK